MNRLWKVLSLLFCCTVLYLKSHYPKKATIYCTIRDLMKISALIIFLAALVTIEGCAPALISSARDGDITEVRNLLENGADVNIETEWANYYEITALMAAAANGHTEVVKLLLDKGADLNVMCPGFPNGVTALMIATVKGHTEIAKLLIDKGADVNAKNPNGETALMYAFKYGYTEIAILLMDKGAEVPDGEPAWLIALKHHHLEMAAKLLSRDIDIPIGKSILVIPVGLLQIYKLNKESMTFKNYTYIDSGNNLIEVGAYDYGSHSVKKLQLSFIAKEGYIYFVNYNITEWSSPLVLVKPWIEEYSGQKGAENK